MPDTLLGDRCLYDEQPIGEAPRREAGMRQMMVGPYDIFIAWHDGNNHRFFVQVHYRNNWAFDLYVPADEWDKIISAEFINLCLLDALPHDWARTHAKRFYEVTT